MPFIGKTPTAVPLTANDITDGIVSNSKLAQDIISAETELATAPADTDEFLISDAGTLKRIDASLVVGGGITVADQYRVSANITSNADPISSNIERVDTSGQGTIGSAMSVSSGVFTFPSTGIYLVTYKGSGYTASGGDNVSLSMSVTINNSSFTQIDSSAAGDGETRNFTVSGGSLIDVTDTSNVKVSFSAGSIDSGSQLDGNTAENRTCFTFIRLGDT
tara:strand:+ start:16 stop:675 length:660 start_codon:yes stop_codon:yes gene_type:complete